MSKKRTIIAPVGAAYVTNEAAAGMIQHVIGLEALSWSRDVEVGFHRVPLAVTTTSCSLIVRTWDTMSSVCMFLAGYWSE